MFKLDDNLLIELGLGSLPATEKNRMLSHIYETLEMRVGMKLAQRMTNEQLDEFEAFIDRNDEAGALKWLESNFPNYKQVVADELEALKAEIKAAALKLWLPVSKQPQAPLRYHHRRSLSFKHRQQSHRHLSNTSQYPCRRSLSRWLQHRLVPILLISNAAIAAVSSSRHASRTYRPANGPGEFI